MEENSSPTEPLLQRSQHFLESSIGVLPVQVKVYKRRWWILFLFASLGFMQCAVWNTWGPITDSVKAAYPSWDEAEIGLLSMWGTITMIIGLVPFTFLLQQKGLRVSILLTSALLALGSAVRLFATEETAFTVMAHLCAILNGFAGIIIGCAPSLLSSTWFPPHERTTATGIGCTFNQLGNAGGFFFGPWLVKDPEKNSSDVPIIFSDTDINTEIIRRSIRDYMWIMAAMCVPLFLFCLAYFPDRPKRPPSLTSAIPHAANTIKEDLSLIAKNTNFWLLMLPYSLTIGVNVAWSSVLDINLGPVGISQIEASNIGVYMTFGGVVLAIIAARFTDLLFGYIKLTIIALLLVSTLTFTWFLFLMNGCLSFDKSTFVDNMTAFSNFIFVTLVYVQLFSTFDARKLNEEYLPEAMDTFRLEDPALTADLPAEVVLSASSDDGTMDALLKFDEMASLQARQDLPSLFLCDAQEQTSGRILLPPIFQVQVPNINQLINKNPINQALRGKLISLRGAIDGLLVTLGGPNPPAGR